MEGFVLCCFYINTTKVLINMKHWFELFPLRLLWMIFERLIMYTFQKLFYGIGALKYFSKFMRWSLCNLTFKKKLQHGCFPVNFAKFFRTPFIQCTSERMILRFCCNSPIKENLSDVSTIGCLLFLGNFPNKRLQSSLRFTLRLQFTFKYLKS